METPINPRRRRARERIQAAREAASDLLEQRRDELREDLQRRMRELEAQRPSSHMA